MATLSDLEQEVLEAVRTAQTRPELSHRCPMGALLITLDHIPGHVIRNAVQRLRGKDYIESVERGLYRVVDGA